MQKALYRIYRPITFNDVIGQENIIRTLKNQIQNNNIAHAYIFSGTRGTGKTSTAKIFARAVNCTNSIDSEPCNECDNCKELFSDSIMDIIEIDAASNNGVDDIRELRDNVKYPPAKGKYKVYIIDEVHMLSQGAFNALLKTLEEPPSYIIFILATTEIQKIPATILSRCQKFEFKRVRNEEIVNRMKKICKDLDVLIEDKALNIIAKNSSGALRDALSILDQCVSFCDRDIKYEDVINMLGSVNIDLLFNVSKYIIEKDAKKALTELNEIMLLGKDMKIFISEIIEHFRNLMICKVANSPNDILELPKDSVELYIKQCESIEKFEIIDIINILSEIENNMKYSNNTRIIVEVGIIKLTQRTHKEDLLKRIEELEKIIKSGVRVFKESNTTEEKVEANTLTNKLDIPENNIIINDEKIEQIWPDVLEYIKKDKKIPVQAMLKEASNFKVEENTLMIIFEDMFKFHKDALNKENNKTYIQGVINKISNSNFKIRLLLKSETNIIVNEVDEGISILENIFPKEHIEVID